MKKNKYKCCDYCGQPVLRETIHHSETFNYMCEKCYKIFKIVAHNNPNKGRERKPKTKAELEAIKEKYKRVNLDDEIKDWIYERIV